MKEPALWCVSLGQTATNCSFIFNLCIYVVGVMSMDIVRENSLDKIFKKYYFNVVVHVALVEMEIYKHCQFISNLVSSSKRCYTFCIKNYALQRYVFVFCFLGKLVWEIFVAWVKYFAYFFHVNTGHPFYWLGLQVFYRTGSDHDGWTACLASMGSLR